MTTTSTQLIMLGTGNAMATRCYNTCFALHTGEDYLLIDAGGGNGILPQLERAGITLAQIPAMFITHAHTDHLLGAVWVVRAIAQQMKAGKYTGTFHVYSHDKALGVLEWICRNTLPGSIIPLLGDNIRFCEVQDGEQFNAGGLSLQCFDILSTKEKQFGFTTRLPDGQRLTCLGDEPYNASNRAFVENADWLLCEAFCLYQDKERFKPYEKHHSTARDAGQLAEELGVRKLLLYHTEDHSLGTRRHTYSQEARELFNGNVYVPDDLERIVL